MLLCVYILPLNLCVSSHVMTLCPSSLHKDSVSPFDVWYNTACNTHLRNVHCTNPLSLFLSLIWCCLCSLVLHLSSFPSCFCFSPSLIHACRQTHFFLCYKCAYKHTHTQLLTLPCLFLKTTALPNILLLYCAVPICFIWNFNPEDLSTCQQPVKKI